MHVGGLRLGFDEFSQRETLIGSGPRKAKGFGIMLKRRAVHASGRTLRFADGTETDADAIILATGYQPDYSWIKVAVVDAKPRGGIYRRRPLVDSLLGKPSAVWKQELRGIIPSNQDFTLLVAIPLAVYAVPKSYPGFFVRWC